MEVISKLVMVETGKIRPYHRNPRRNDRTVAELVKLIPKVGFNVPLVLDRDNIIVKGHSRWRAAVELEMPQVPCVYSDADPETIRLDRLADNKVQEFSGWNNELLASELASLNLGFEIDLAATLNFRMELPGFSIGGADDQGTGPQRAGAAATPPPAAGNGAPPPAPPEAPDDGKPFISERDIARTVNRGEHTYRQVVCPQCGTVMQMRQGGR